MRWISDNNLDEFFQNKNFDIRINKNARWIDQKCTPDVITIIADCILAYVEENEIDSIFTSMDIWHNEYTINNVFSIFKKPNPNADNARNEYDKFFQQPMELLAYSGVLKKTKKGNRNFYQILDIDMLQYLALREKNSLLFLNKYITKVLSDSNILYVFNNFFDNPNKISFNEMKKTFINFTIQYTDINKVTEPRRIFTKIVNPLAYYKNAKGSEKGVLSKHIITLDMLMYNRDNFRDLYNDKPKDMTRKEYETSLENHIKNKASYYRYLSTKAKRIVRDYNNMFNNGYSELIQDGQRNDKATVIHHIFPESEFPTICYYNENLIALTPTQHINYTHPNGNTSIIDKNYQYLCLLAKSDVIEKSYKFNRGLYEFAKFIDVICIGLKDESYREINHLDFITIAKKLNDSYNKEI